MLVGSGNICCSCWTLGLEGLWCISCWPSSAWQGYSRELFQFEEDRFDNVPALIRFYVGGRQPISQASGAVIFHPITRTLPLRVIREQQAGAGSGKQAKSSKRRSLSTAHAEMLQTINPLLRCETAGWKACSQVLTKRLLSKFSVWQEWKSACKPGECWTQAFTSVCAVWQQLTNWYHFNYSTYRRRRLGLCHFFLLHFLIQRHPRLHECKAPAPPPSLPCFGLVVNPCWAHDTRVPPFQVTSIKAHDLGPY